jgi:hypothetical protein
MPRTNIDYNNTIIYKIVCNDLNITDVYVGSTTDFTKRKSCHKSRCNNEKSKFYNIKLYQTIRLNGGWDNWLMCEIEKYPCDDSNEAKSRERYYYELLNTTLNMICPIRSNDEIIESIKQYQSMYMSQNKETKKQYDKEYALSNKEKIKQYQKQYRQNNKEKISEYIKNYNKAKKLNLTV